jgi:hypothetical protein
VRTFRNECHNDIRFATIWFNTFSLLPNQTNSHFQRLAIVVEMKFAETAKLTNESVSETTLAPAITSEPIGKQRPCQRTRDNVADWQQV